MEYLASDAESERLEAAYSGRIPFHGELHDHSASGGTSDGAYPLDVWKTELAALHMDFAAILDHRQVRHMYLPEWDNSVFLCGTEPGTIIRDSGARSAELHYNLLVPTPGELEALLAEFPEFGFTGGPEGHFTYPYFDTARFGEIADAVRAHGGMFVIPHPKQIMDSDNPLDYWFRDETGIEAVYESLDSRATEEDTALWLELLRRGKRVWACAGCDHHSHASDTALTTVYAESRRNTDLLSVLRRGDFTCGPVGIRMEADGILSGGHGDLTGKRIIAAVGDFHCSVKHPEHRFRMDIIDDGGVRASAPVSCGETGYFAFDPVPGCAFCRIEVWDETRNLRIALGNPIWNDACRR